MTTRARARRQASRRAFWLAGFEGADHVNAAGVPLDMVAMNGHLERLDEDHRRVAQAGFGAVRESLGWRLAEPAGGGAFDFERLLRVEASARRHGLAVWWTLMHYGLPPDLTLHDDALIERFARFARAALDVLVRERRGHGDTRPPVITPVNEINFLAWAASQWGLLAPPNGPDAPTPVSGSSLVSGYAVKRRLARAALAGIDAMREVEPALRLMHVEPVVHVVAPPGRPDLADEAATVRSWQWQAFDLLAGRLEPELGGHPQALDILGINHYHSSQWELITEARLLWHRHDPRRCPLAMHLHEAHTRYGRPIVIAETGHVGHGRADWLHDVATQVRRARADGVPVEAMCLYPAVDPRAWHDPTHFHRSGLWHAETATHRRVVVPAFRDALEAWQRELPVREGDAPSACLVVVAPAPWDAWPPHPAQAAVLALSRCAPGAPGPRWHVSWIEPEPADVEGAMPAVVPQGPALDVIVPRQAPASALVQCLGPDAPPGAIAARVVWALDPDRRPLARTIAAELGAELIDAATRPPMLPADDHRATRRAATVLAQRRIPEPAA